MKTKSNISIELKSTSDNDDIIYIIKSKLGHFEVNCKGDGGLLVSSHIKTMSSAIGGRGEDDGKNAWFTDENCKSNSEAVHNILELLMTISK